MCQFGSKGKRNLMVAVKLDTFFYIYIHLLNKGIFYVGPSLLNIRTSRKDIFNR